MQLRVQNRGLRRHPGSARLRPGSQRAHHVTNSCPSIRPLLVRSVTFGNLWSHLPLVAAVLPQQILLTQLQLLPAPGPLGLTGPLQVPPDLPAGPDAWLDLRVFFFWTGSWVINFTPSWGLAGPVLGRCKLHKLPGLLWMPSHVRALHA